ncbi:protein Xis [Pseudomonas sp. Ag1]|uniref:citrate synthase n=1 Tax=Pseudomonas sp. Ag1 TaxID=1197727 RepID=UPI000272C8B5|nr:citrate synthase [Pseudomonas sp. Ag1]EJF69771.1 protein Xis [Pseudomonas sp. Ag1]
MPSEDDLYMSADEAAGLLGIAHKTLYAYVSRKNIRSLKVGTSRSRRYWAADIHRLLVEQGAAAAPAPSPQVATRTNITLLTEQGLYYRGHDVAVLAESSSVESVAQMMWQVDGAFDHPLPKVPAGATAILDAMAQTSAVEKAIALFPLIERDNPRAHDLSMQGLARTGAEVMRWFAALIVGAKCPAAGPLPQAIARALELDEAGEDLIRRILILSVDHEFDPATYTVRAAANAGVTPYYSTIAGLSTFRGRRLSYARTEMMVRMLEEIYVADDPREPILLRNRQGEPIPGFGSNQHSIADPRAKSLLNHLRRIYAHDEDFQRLLIAAETVEEISGKPLDFILLLVFCGRKLNMRGQEIVLAGLGRMVGWLAHASEQYHQHDLIRHHAVYTGPLPGPA